MAFRDDGNRTQARDWDLSSLSWLAVFLHWLVGSGIILMLIFGFVLWSMPSGPEKNALIPLHKSFGVLVGIFALLRLLLRVREGWPVPATQPAVQWEVRAAHVVHTLLLISTIALPLSGMAKSITYARPVSAFGVLLVPPLITDKNEFWHGVASVAHNGFALLVTFLLALHVVAALKHHFFDRDSTLKRMFGFGSL